MRPPDNLKRAAWLKVARFYVLNVNVICGRVELLHTPSRCEHRANVAATPQHIFEAHNVFTRKGLGRMMRCYDGSRPRAKQGENIARKTAHVVASRVLVALSESRSGIEKNMCASHGE